jgi:hypothetical protein
MYFGSSSFICSDTVESRYQATASEEELRKLNACYSEL